MEMILLQQFMFSQCYILCSVSSNENQRLMANDNAHTTIFFPVGKYATDVHYQIIRIPIHLTPIEASFTQAGEMMHHMGNIVRGKATETPIKQIIKHHNQTLSKVKEGYDNILLNLPAAQFTPYGSRKKRILDLLFGIAGKWGFRNIEIRNSLSE